MAKKQNDFLNEYVKLCQKGLGISPQKWMIGQRIENTSLFTHVYESLRRGQGPWRAERIEIGDMRAEYNGWTIMIEYDNYKLTLSNLMKLWLFSTGKMDVQPKQPIIICYFSDWKSYGSQRDIAEWFMTEFDKNKKKKVKIFFKQFDNLGKDSKSSKPTILQSFDWIKDIVSGKNDK